METPWKDKGILTPGPGYINKRTCAQERDKKVEDEKPEDHEEPDRGAAGPDETDVPLHQAAARTPPQKVTDGADIPVRFYAQQDFRDRCRAPEDKRQIVIP